MHMSGSNMMQEGRRNFHFHGWQYTFLILYNVQQVYSLSKYLFKKVYSSRALYAIYTRGNASLSLFGLCGVHTQNARIGNYHKVFPRICTYLAETNF
jgi:hypothetical protein